MGCEAVEIKACDEGQTVEMEWLWMARNIPGLSRGGPGNASVAFRHVRAPPSPRTTDLAQRPPSGAPASWIAEAFLRRTYDLKDSVHRVASIDRTRPRRPRIGRVVESVCRLGFLTGNNLHSNDS